MDEATTFDFGAGPVPAHREGRSGLRVLSLFSGCGGLDLGFEEQGFETAFCVEWDYESCKTLRHNRPQWPIHEGDIRGFSAEGLDVQGVIGGPPCQGFSPAGKGNPDDPRNMLWREYFRVVRETHPEFILLENVPGMLHAKNRPHFDALVAAFSDLGYIMTYGILNAADFGVPQNRKRLIVTGGAGFRIPLPRPSVRNPVTVRTAIQDLEGSSSVPNHRPNKHAPQVVQRWSELAEGETDPGYRRARLHADRPSTTLRAGGGYGPKGNHLGGFHPPIHYRFPRQLTVRESARIQGFPDDWELKGSKTAQGRQVGNAVPPPLASAIAGACLNATLAHRAGTTPPELTQPPSRGVDRRPRVGTMTVVELFGGAGGAALGIRAAMPGADHVLVEWDADAAAVLRAAKLGRVIEADVHDAIHDLPLCPDLLWASPPCQPYSRAGKRKGAADVRDCWPVTLQAIARTRPAYVTIENVRGSPAEQWALEIRSLGYSTAVWDIDAADVGVPQRRHRRFVVGRRDGGDLVAPIPTHSQRALAVSKWVTGSYWREHGIERHGEPTRAEARALRDGGDGRLRWRTVRDVLDLVGWVRTEQVGAVASTIDEPAGTVPTAGNQYAHAEDVGRRGKEDRSGDREGGRFHSSECQCAVCLAVVAEWVARHPREEKGTRASASSGWTMHGGPDRASDAVWLATGRRRLTPEECSVLQDFPPDWPWHVCRTKSARYKAVGNAVPPALAAAVVCAMVRPSMAPRPQLTLWRTP